MSDHQPLHLPRGFRFASGTAGIKQSGSPDLMLAVSDVPASAVAMFTTNQFVAAPVLVGKRNLKLSGNQLRAVVVNSGNANCATGTAGERAAEQTCSTVAQQLKIDASEVLPSSTGIIGVPLPVEKLIAAIPTIANTLSAEESAAHAAAQAIMTTDTRPKIASASFDLGGKRCAVMGFAKGAGMIHPNMATMLGYVFTDIEATPAELERVFRPAVARSFNAISVDGDTSTNDTVLILANGQSGVPLASTRAEFSQALRTVCDALAYKIVSDGEGVKHVIRLTVTGAENDYAAHRVADVISTSLLVKTAWAGSDPNWGRMVAAAGRSGEVIDTDVIEVMIQDTCVCRNGASQRFDAAALHAAMQAFDVDISITVGTGAGTFSLLTCDLTEEYVRINADYST